MDQFQAPTCLAKLVQQTELAALAGRSSANIHAMFTVRLQQVGHETCTASTRQSATWQHVTRITVCLSKQLVARSVPRMTAAGSDTGCIHSSELAVYVVLSFLCLSTLRSSYISGCWICVVKCMFHVRVAMLSLSKMEKQTVNIKYSHSLMCSKINTPAMWTI